MKQTSENYFILDRFEGPLDYLLPLIKKSEIDVLDIILREIIDQYTTKFMNLLPTSPLDLDGGAEFIGTFSHLLWLKSLTLLPQHEQVEMPEEEGEDPRFEMIHHLVDYCRFRDAAKNLTEQESKQNNFYSRGVGDLPESKKNLGIEHLSLDDFADLFQKILIKSSSQNGTIHEDKWRVSDLIHLIRTLFSTSSALPLNELFSQEKSRGELIVTFLAILELLKLGEITVTKEIKSGIIFVNSTAN